MHRFNRAFMILVVLLFILLAAMTAPAQTFRNLVYFDGSNGSNSGYGYAGLVQGTDGYLYGTTPEGGANDGCGAAGCGTVFRITPGGVLTTLYSFCGQSGCVDGLNPFSGLVEGADGDFYGTTNSGGGLGNCAPDGCGTVFKITRNGDLTTLHKFDGDDGAWPWGALIRGSDGNFYGTTVIGGPSCGTVFKITPDGTLTTLYGFCANGDCTDGANPGGGLIEGEDGSFYGVTSQGGITTCLHAKGSLGCGTVFRITPSGTLTTIHKFNFTDGAGPSGGLVQGSDGAYYGTTELGANKGCDDGFSSCGTVFKITPGGPLTTLYRFCSEADCADGYWPLAGLVQGTDGQLYGTAYRGGTGFGCTLGCGTVFRITTAGALTTLYSFPYGGPYGPAAPLIQDTNGIFYGTTIYGGSQNCNSGCGEIFALFESLGPFVKTEPVFGRAGGQVRILGTDLTGAMSVTFNGTGATFTVVSPSLITTTVPAGATTGTVQVVTPGGTLSSNIPFRVIQ